MAATVIICILLAAAVVLGIRNYKKHLGSGCCGSGGDAPKKLKPRDRDLSHYPYEKILEIDGMTCSNCVTHVENALNSLDGVYSKVNLGKKRALVRMKEDLPEPLLRKTVADAGYMVKSVSVNA